MRAILFTLFAIFFSFNILDAQEYLDGIIGNPVLQNYHPSTTLKSANETPLQLPFIDDFSYNSYIPSDKLWDDRAVFINNSYGIAPYSVGVATFDAVNGNGQHYTNASSSLFRADSLTSKTIDLTNADRNSLVISFFYQPQGNGNAPEKEDSLVLQISTKVGKWTNIWSAPGTSFEEFKKDSLHLFVSANDTMAFKYVAIALTDTSIFKSNFRFRFHNYGSLASSGTPSAAVNCDHWNIDFVYLDDHRNVTENVFYDVAFTNTAITCLKNYTSIPWKHYDAAIGTEGTRIHTTIRNNYDHEIKSNLHFVVYDITNNSIAIDSNNNGSSNYYELTNLPGNWDCEENPIVYNNQFESAKFLFKSVLEPDDADIIRGNDTAYTTQVFDNYYAYDDGTAENAYGIDAAYAMAAYKFISYQSDSLRAFNWYFLQNHPIDGAADNFVACVWKADNNGLPGKMIVEKEIDKRPSFPGSITGFVSTDLDTAVFIEKGEVFFIGWQQNSDLRMNVGWDQNKFYLNQNHLYYNITGDWIPSAMSGSLMLRPVFSQNPLSSVNEKNSQNINIVAYPNPAQTNFIIHGIEQGSETKIFIYNALGKLVKHNVFTNQSIDIADLPNGIYLVSIRTKNATVKTIKLIKNQ